MWQDLIARSTSQALVQLIVCETVICIVNRFSVIRHISIVCHIRVSC
jgi:hypothetical protein